jgi:hypothetical protein
MFRTRAVRSFSITSSAAADEANEVNEMDPETRLYLAKFRIAEAHREADDQRRAKALRAAVTPVRNITVAVRRLQRRPATA